MRTTVRPVQFGGTIGEGWYLAYDAGCTRCNSIQQIVEKEANGKLTCIGLRDPIVESWRREALGSNAPWAPTLIHVSDSEVAAFVGKTIAIRLVTLLGPGAGWRIAQRLADIQTPVTVNRRSFSKGLAGAITAIGLVGSGHVVAAEAEQEPPELPISEEEAAAADPCSLHYAGTITSPTKVLAGSGLALRDKPCTSDSTVLSYIPCGTWVDRFAYYDQPVSVYNSCVGEYRRRWYKVSYGGVLGYITSVYTNTGLGYDPGCC